MVVYELDTLQDVTEEELEAGGGSQGIMVEDVSDGPPVGERDAVDDVVDGQRLTRVPRPERLVVDRHLADGSDSRANVDEALTGDAPTWVCSPGDVPHLRGGWNGHGAGGSSGLDGCVTAVVHPLACLWV